MAVSKILASLHVATNFLSSSEYIQELEARLCPCELQGIVGSSEIQLTARRVVDENKNLRKLLAQHGDSIEAYLQSCRINGSDAMMGEQFNAPSRQWCHSRPPNATTWHAETVLWRRIHQCMHSDDDGGKMWQSR
jgi:hypothetical protein